MKKTRRSVSWKLVLTLLLAAVLAFSFTACSKSKEQAAVSGTKEPEKITLRIGAGQTPEGFTWIESVVEYFFPHVEKKLAETGNYEIEWVEAWGGTVAKVDEIMEAVESGVLDLGWVGNVFEAASLPLNNIAYHCPFSVYDPDQMVYAMEKMYTTYPELLAEYAKFKNKVLGYTMLESYNLATNFKVEKMADLDGKKIGAAGANLTWFGGTGAVAVQSPGTEAYSCIQTGVYDGTLQHTLMLEGLKLYEVAPYILIGNFGAIWGGAITINTDVWDKLPQEVQQALVEAGDAYMRGTAELEKVKLEKATSNMEAKGATVTVLSEDQRALWANSLENLPKKYADQLEKLGIPKGREMIKAYLTFLEEAGSDMPRKWFDE
jgi:TRAP-type C4-dicarboxylate transport system substrate-binding protein